jgi:hypothetical protein
MVHRPESFDDSAFQADILDELKRGDFDQFEDTALEEAVATRIFIDVDKAKLQKARRIIEQWYREGVTRPHGYVQLPLPFGPLPYEPIRLVSNGKGQSIELDRAPLDFRQAELARKEENLKAVQASYDRCKAEIDIYRKWHDRERAAGRDSLDLTWGNCIREIGILRDTDGSGEAVA